MPTVTSTQLISRPVSEVFATVSDLRTFPNWNPTTVAVEKTTDGPIGEGTRYQMKIRGFGKQEIELQNFETDRSVRLVPHSAMIGGGHLWRFTDDQGETRIDHELVMIPKGLMKLMAPLMGVMARKNLKDTSQALADHFQS